MKVLCINNKFLDKACNRNEYLSQLKEFEEYTVTQFTPDFFDGFYHLLEIPTPPTIGFAAERFVPLSEIDEMELVNERVELLTV